MMPLHALLTLLLIASPSVNSAHVNLYTDPTYSSLYGRAYNMGVIGQNSTMTFANFEIELMGIGDVPSLYSESDIIVLGKVQQTPRYNVSGEACVKGVWVNRDFDISLADRFVVNCTEDKAIDTSTYAWVEWTAPVLKGTTYEGEMPPPGGEFGILFEYGAESGVLQPPWDKVGPSGSGGTPDAYTELDDAHVRSGSYAIHIHQPPLPKSDADRRVVAQYYRLTELEFYFSFWVFYPTEYDDIVRASDWLTTGGLTLYWHDDVDDKWGTHKGLRLRTSPGKDATGFYDQVSWSGIDDSSSDTPTWSKDSSDPWGVKGARPWYWDATKIYLTLNQWHHYQFYMKVSTGTNNNGAVAAWIDNSICLNQTNIPTNPSRWGFPLAGGGYDCGKQGPYYSLNVEQYGDRYTTPELDVWFDDIVAAMEKVSETYRAKV